MHTNKREKVLLLELYYLVLQKITLIIKIFKTQY